MSESTRNTEMKNKIQNRSDGLAEPPEGAIRGESVPAGSEPDEYEDAKVTRMMGLLKARGEPYSLMSDFELKKKARELMKGGEN